MTESGALAAAGGGPRGVPGALRARSAHARSVQTALAVLALIVLLALLGPAVSPWDYDTIDWQHLAVSPGGSAGHWLGTDRLGRDLFVRTLYGVRLSMLVGVLSSIVSVGIGLAWGSTAGYFGSRTGGLMMRIVDVLYSLPTLFIVIIAASLFGRGSIGTLLLAIAAVGWLTTARVVRAQTLALREREYIEAALTLGQSAPRILLRHIVPALLGPVLVYATLTVPQMILFESFLSFLGLGVQEPLASLGNLVSDGAREMQSAPWMLMVPAATLMILLLCLNRLGDGLRDALDPRSI